MITFQKSVDSNTMFDTLRATVIGLHVETWEKGYLNNMSSN